MTRTDVPNIWLTAKPIRALRPHRGAASSAGRARSQRDCRDGHTPTPAVSRPHAGRPSRSELGSGGIAYAPGAPQWQLFKMRVKYFFVAKCMSATEQIQQTPPEMHPDVDRAMYSKRTV